MAEISNTTLAVLVFAALVVVIGGTALNFMSFGQGPTGYLSSDTGNVSLGVSSNLAIQVDANNNTINFGNCTPRTGSSYWCATNDSVNCDNVTTTNNCSLDTATSQWIQINNIGNVNASINITNNQCDASTLIGGTSPLFQYIATACNGTGVSAWTSFAAGAQQNQICTDDSYLGGKLRLYVNITIPQNAVGPTGACSSNNRTQITFTGTVAP